MDLVHRRDHLLHRLSTTAGHIGRVYRHGTGGLCVVGVLAHGGRQLFHAGGGFFQAGGLLLGALRQVQVAA
ncbi:hypothetical protein SDC9_184591 [bioreactor metagenome]|uniref:Uncharacterized protein n=1 Tax=bioreactor metagenome TaxID=1076179 RepID=A0A645HDG2_9ZZZZ